MIFTIKYTDFFKLRGFYAAEGSIAPEVFTPGVDYVWSQLGANGPFPTVQYNWQPGSTGSELLLEGFKGFVPLPVDWTGN
jgi:hypothetical protein